MAFEVLLSHFAKWDEYNPLIVWPFRQLVSLAVPCFIAISFFLTAKSFINKDETKFKTRLYRLLIPQIGWAFIYYIIYALIDLTMHKNLHSGINDLFWQLFTGHSRYLNPSMWYQIDMIVVTIIFYYIFKLFDNKKSFIILSVITLLCYFLQFSGINVLLFGNLEFELKYPLGRIAEVIPYAYIGFTMKYLNIFDKLKPYRYAVMFICIVLFMLGFRIPWITVDDFVYGGLAKPYLMLCVLTFAYLVPLEKLKIRCKKIILKVTDYTLGIYCSHRLINTLLAVFLPTMKMHSFERCLIIYALSYAVCSFIDLIPNKTIKALIK